MSEDKIAYSMMYWKYRLLPFSVLCQRKNAGAWHQFLIESIHEDLIIVYLYVLNLAQYLCEVLLNATR